MTDAQTEMPLPVDVPEDKTPLARDLIAELLIDDEQRDAFNDASRIAHPIPMTRFTLCEFGSRMNRGKAWSTAVTQCSVVGGDPIVLIGKREDATVLVADTMMWRESIRELPRKGCGLSGHKRSGDNRHS